MVEDPASNASRKGTQCHLEGRSKQVHCTPSSHSGDLALSSSSANRKAADALAFVRGRCIIMSDGLVALGSLRSARWVAVTSCSTAVIDVTAAITLQAAAHLASASRASLQRQGWLQCASGGLNARGQRRGRRREATRASRPAPSAPTVRRRALRLHFGSAAALLGAATSCSKSVASRLVPQVDCVHTETGGGGAYVAAGASQRVRVRALCRVSCRVWVRATGTQNFSLAAPHFQAVRLI